MDELVSFDPHVVGTPPLGLDMADSDIDIVCHAPDPNRFAMHLYACFSGCPTFSVHQWVRDDRPIIARFTADHWPIEIFGQSLAVEHQAGWRHFRVEQRLLTLGGPPFRANLVRARQAGRKTEPAFADCLGIPGDPYAALLDLFEQTDDVLIRLLRARGYRA